jgi:dephospho-CoA kinase
MAAQLDRDTRIERSDIVINNSTSLDALHERAAVLHDTLLARAAAH